MSVVTTGQITIADLNDAVSATLSNETFVAPANPDGGGPDLTGAATTMKVFLGGVDDSANWTVAAALSSGVTGSLSGKTYTVTGMTVNSGYVDLTASRIGFPSITRRFSLSKARKGNRGSVTTARSIAGTAWSDSEAATAVASVNGDAPAAGDMVTLHNSAQKFSQTRVRQPDNSWSQVTEFFGGDVMVKGSLTASKITIGDTSNMIPDPDFRDTESWSSDITGFSFTNGTSFEAADRICLINGFTSTGSANGYAGDIKTTPITIEPETDYAVSVVFRSNSTNTEGVIQLIWVEYDNAGAQVGYVTVGSMQMGNTAPVKISGRIKTAATGARGVFRVRLQRNAAGNFMGTVRFYNPVMRRAVSGELVVDGSIEGKHVKANTIKAKHLEIGSRNLTLTGIAFEHNAPSINSVSWTTGSIRYVDDAGAVTSKTITAGNAAWTSGVLYIYWAKGATALSTTTNQSTAFDDDNVLLATYEGGIKLDADYGRTIIDGAAIKTGSITSVQIKADEIKSVNIEADAIETRHIKAGTIRASKLQIGDTSNLFPDPMMVDPDMYSGAVAYGLHSSTESIAGSSTNFLQINAGSVGEVLSAPFPAEGSANYYVASVMEVSSTGTGQPTLLVRFYSDLAGTVMISEEVIGTRTSTTWGRVFRNDVTAPSTTRSARFVFQQNVATPSGRNSRWAEPIMRRSTDAKMIVNGTIDATKLVSGEVITGSAQIRDAIINDAHIESVSAAKLTAGTALVGSLTVSGKALSALKDDAELGASDPVGRINGGTTTINGGKITTGTIEAAQIKAETIGASKLIVRDMTNLVPNGQFDDGEDISDYWGSISGAGNRSYFLRSSDSGYSKTGVRSICLQKNAGSTGSINVEMIRYFPVEEDSILYCETAIRTLGTATAAGCYFRVKFFSSSKSYISQHDVISNGPIPATWTKYSKQITVPAGACFARIQLYNHSTQTTTDTLLFDRLVVRKAGAAELIVDGSIKGSHIESDTIDTGHLKAGSIRASKLRIGDTSNMVPDPDFNDTSAWVSSFSQFAFANGGANEAASRICTISGLTSTGSANGFVGDIRTTEITVEPDTDYNISVVFRSNSTSTKGVIQLRWLEYDNTGAQIADRIFASFSMGESSAASRVSGKFKTTSTASRGVLRIRLQRSAAGNFMGTVRFYNPVVRRSVSAELIVEGTIDATKLVSGEVITKSAQIKDAIINDAHIADLSAGKLTAGSALAGSITVSGKALSALKSDAELGASDPGARINSGVTKINPGQITISGGTTLANWRGSDTTKINGGEIQTNTVTLEKLAAGTGRNLLMNTAFATMLGWSRAGSGGVHSASVLSKREGGEDWAGGNYPVLMLRQTGTATDGYSDITSRHITLPGTEFAGSVPVKPGVYYEASAQISTHRCGGVLLIMFFDRNSAFISQVFSNLGTDVQGSSTNPDDWVRYVVRAQAPANAAYAGITARKYGTTSGGDSYLFFHKPQIIETVAGATQAAPYSPGGYTYIDGGSIVTDSIEADRIKAGVITADKMNTGSFSTAGLSLFGGALQSDNYVPNTSGWRIGKNGVAEFEDLLVRSKNIEPEAVTASKLKIGDPSNMVLNDWSRGSTDGWTIGGQIAFTFAANTLSHSGWRLESNARDQAWSPFVPCTPSEWYYVSVWVYNNATETANLVINSRDGNGANSYWGVVGTTTKGAWVHLKGWWQAPGGATQIRMLLQVAKTSTGGNSTYWTKPVMRRASDRDMVVDGEITAGKLNVTSLETAGLSVFGGSLKSDNFVPGTSGWRIGKTGVAEFEDLIVRSKNIDLNAVSKLREVTLAGVTGETGNGNWVTAGSYVFTPEGDDPVSIWLCALGALTPGSGVYGQLDVRILFRGTERVLYEGAASWLGTNTGRTMINIADRVTSGGSSSGTISIQAKANAGTFALKNIRLLLGEFKR